MTNNGHETVTEVTVDLNAGLYKIWAAAQKPLIARALSGDIRGYFRAQALTNMSYLWAMKDAKQRYQKSMLNSSADTLSSRASA